MSTGVLFWLIALALVVATLAALVVPLLRRASEPVAPAEADASAAIFRAQSQELDDDVAAGAIGADERARAREEIVARLGDELAAAPAPAAAASSPRASWIAAIAIVALLPASVLVAYFALGNPAALDANAPRARMTEPEIVAMVDRLAERMKAQPDDPRGWLLLGRSMGALQRFPESADAYAQAAARMPDDAGVLADWADALAMAQGRKLAGKPTEIIERALKADPTHPKALALAASAAMERRDDAGAIRYWNALLATLPPDSEQARDVRETIAQLGGQASVPPAASAPPAAAGPSSPSSPSSSPPAAGGGRVAGRVVVAPSLAARVPPQATLFVYARAADGPRMPLAIVRASAGALPLDFALDDAMAMAPGMTISSAREVVVEARVSASGSATPTSGDLSGVSGPVAPGTSGVVVTINRIVP